MKGKKWTIASAIFGVFLAIGAPIITLVLDNKASKEAENENNEMLQQMVSKEINAQLTQLIQDATSDPQS